MPCSTFHYSITVQIEKFKSIICAASVDTRLRKLSQDRETVPARPLIHSSSSIIINMLVDLFGGSLCSSLTSSAATRCVGFDDPVVACGKDGTFATSKNPAWSFAADSSTTKTETNQDTEIEIAEEYMFDGCLRLELPGIDASSDLRSAEMIFLLVALKRSFEVALKQSGYPVLSSNFGEVFVCGKNGTVECDVPDVDAREDQDQGQDDRGSWNKFVSDLFCGTKIDSKEVLPNHLLKRLDSYGREGCKAWTKFDAYTRDSCVALGLDVTLGFDAFVSPKKANPILLCHSFRLMNDRKYNDAVGDKKKKDAKIMLKWEGEFSAALKESPFYMLSKVEGPTISFWRLNAVEMPLDPSCCIQQQQSDETSEMERRRQDLLTRMLQYGGPAPTNSIRE